MRGLSVSFLLMSALIASAVAATPARPLPMPQSSFENIKVLTDMSDTDIRNEMNDWTEALGVTCTYCHVTGDFPSDMNPKKETARKMAADGENHQQGFPGRQSQMCPLPSGCRSSEPVVWTKSRSPSQTDFTPLRIRRSRAASSTVRILRRQV